MALLDTDCGEFDVRDCLLEYLYELGEVVVDLALLAGLSLLSQ